MPELRRRRRLVASLPEPDRAGARGGRRAADRQPERGHAGRVDALCPRHEEAGATAIELNVYDVPGDPKVTVRTSRRGTSMSCPGARRRRDPGRGEAGPVLQLDRLDGHAARHRRRRAASCSSTASSSPRSTPTRSRSRLGSTSRARRPAPAGDVDRDPARPGRRVARGVGRRRDAPPTSPGSCSRAPTSS